MNPSCPPPSSGFFHGNYGGPRTQLSSENFQQYNFLRNKNEKLDTSGVKQPGPFSNSVEPLNDDILEGCANLTLEVGKRVQVILRDGRLIVGELASVDNFSNLLLRDAAERIVVQKYFGDIPRGIFIIRGDNLVLIGEIDGEREGKMESVLQEIPMDEILCMQKIAQVEVKAKEMRYAEALKHRGVSFPRALEDEF